MFQRQPLKAAGMCEQTYLPSLGSMLTGSMYSWSYSTLTKGWHLHSRPQDLKMVSVIAITEKRRMDVKTEPLPSWILMQDLTPKGTVGRVSKRLLPVPQVCQCEERAHRGGFYVAGILHAFQLLPFIQGHSNISSYTSTTEEGPVWIPAFLTMTFFARHPW